MLARLSLLKERLGIPPYETANDRLLEYFIKLTSYRLEKECKRFFKRQENFGEEFSADESELLVSRYPIESVEGIQIKRSEQDGWETLSDLVYVVRHQCIVSLSRPAGSYLEQLKLIYTGGYVLPGEVCGEGQTPLPDDIENACVEQAAYLFKNRERLGLVGFAGLRSDFNQLFGSSDSAPQPEGNSNIRLFLQFEQIDLLPSVRAILLPYRRQG
ncbi:MAG: hypothetical protein ACP5MG_13315 [Verrucomicrobiia bacterium]|jgi:hypothetical protein